MAGAALRLTLLEPTFAVCRLAADAVLPAWALGGSLSSVTRTPRELSVVCEQSRVPSGAQVEVGWRCLMVEGPLDFGQIGVLASLTAPLAASKVSVFAISTFDTDFLLVKQANLERALSSLGDSGFTVRCGQA